MSKFVCECGAKATLMCEGCNAAYYCGSEECKARFAMDHSCQSVGSLFLKKEMIPNRRQLRDNIVEEIFGHSVIGFNVPVYFSRRKRRLGEFEVPIAVEDEPGHKGIYVLPYGNIDDLIKDIQRMKGDFYVIRAKRIFEDVNQDWNLLKRICEEKEEAKRLLESEEKEEEEEEEKAEKIAETTEEIPLISPGQIKVCRIVPKSEPRGEPVNVLAIDGGGIKGAAAVRLLLGIFNEVHDMTINGALVKDMNVIRVTKGENTRYLAPHQVFDVVCGTSTGSFVAYWIAIKRRPLSELLETYQKLADVVFPAPRETAEFLVERTATELNAVISELALDLDVSNVTAGFDRLRHSTLEYLIPLRILRWFSDLYVRKFIPHAFESFTHTEFKDSKEWFVKWFAKIIVDNNLLWMFHGRLRAKWDADRLRDQIVAITGPKSLLCDQNPQTGQAWYEPVDEQGHRIYRSPDRRPRFFCTAMNLTENDGNHQIIFTNYSHDSSVKAPCFAYPQIIHTSGLYSWQALRASSAAPTYFDPMTINIDSWKEIKAEIQSMFTEEFAYKPYDISKGLFVDGGVGANNPTFLGFVEAAKSYGAQNIGLVMSLGVGEGIVYRDNPAMNKYIEELQRTEIVFKPVSDPTVSLIRRFNATLSVVSSMVDIATGTSGSIEFMNTIAATLPNMVFKRVSTVYPQAVEMDSAADVNKVVKAAESTCRSRRGIVLHKTIRMLLKIEDFDTWNKVIEGIMIMGTT